MELLQAGEPVVSLCKRAAEECDNKVKPSTMRADIAKWSESLSMGEQFKAALALWRNDGAGGLLLSDSWHDDFFRAMEHADGVIEEACELACIGPDLVYARLDPRNKKFYDEEFANRVRVLEGLRLSKVRENVFKQALADNADGGKIGLKLLETSMPGLHQPKQKVEISGKIEHGLSPDVIAASAARTRTLLAGRGESAKALPEGRSEGRVIDIRPRVAEKVHGEER